MKIILYLVISALLYYAAFTCGPEHYLLGAVCTGFGFYWALKGLQILTRKE